eukprot:EST44620.1 Hypothetical protein SS50377_15625 [Spironucleus salmonicida]
MPQNIFNKVDQQISLIIQSDSDLRVKIAQLEEITIQHQLLAYQVIQFGIFEFLFQNISKFPSTILAILADLVQPDLEVLYLQNLIFLQPIFSLITTTYHPHILSKYLFLLCRLNQQFQLEIFVGLGHQALKNIQNFDYQIDPDSEMYFLQLFRYVSKSLFFTSFFSSQEVYDFLVCASKYKLAQTQNYFEIYSNHLLHQIDFYNFIEVNEEQNNAISLLKISQKVPFTRLLIGLISQAQTGNLILFALNNLKTTKVSSSLARFSVIFMHKIIIQFNINIDNLDVNFKVLSQIAGGQRFELVHQAVQELIYLSEELTEDEKCDLIGYFRR